MLKKEIRVGGHYRAKVSNKLTIVRVTSIDDCVFGRRKVTRYHCINIATGRKVFIKSAAKFREVVGTRDNPITGDNIIG